MAIVKIDSTAMVVPLIDGIPDLPNRINLATFVALGNGRDIAFDAADNLYEVTSGRQALRVFSPGGISQTIFDSAGNFTTINDPTYTAPGGASNLSAAGNWLLGVVPNAKDKAARIVGTTAATVTVD